MKKYRTHSAEFKAMVVLEVLQRKESVHAIADKYGLHPTMLHTWKRQLMERANEVFPTKEKMAAKLRKK